jgi:LmbE family N-acetylglucosaminyl deacetylase
MHIDSPGLRSVANAALFLFAHQDDEFGVMHQIEKEIKSGSTVYCVYATTGVLFNEDPKCRNEESRKVLITLGVTPNHILFMGEALGISDGNVSSCGLVFSQWLLTWVQQRRSLTTVYIPAWEGGHTDHDALHAVTIETTPNNCPEITLWQYPLYNSEGLKWGLFRVLTPLCANGHVHYENILWVARWRYLRLCLSYKSQFKSWLGLLPFVFWHYMFRGWQSLQLTSFTRIQERPHNGQLYCEFRNRP